MNNARNDTHWKLAVLELDNWECQVCGSPKHLDAAHIFPRRYAATRYDPTNGVTLCRIHHEYFHQHPREFQVFVQNFLRV